MANSKSHLHESVSEPVAEYATDRARADAAEMAQWRKEAAYFDSVKPELLKQDRYRGRFVAVKDERIVDNDDDKFRLARRVYERFPGEVVFVGEVRLGPRVVHLRSPRVVG